MKNTQKINRYSFNTITSEGLDSITTYINGLTVIASPEVETINLHNYIKDTASLLNSITELEQNINEELEDAAEAAREEAKSEDILTFKPKEQIHQIIKQAAQGKPTVSRYSDFYGHEYEFIDRARIYILNIDERQGTYKLEFLVYDYDGDREKISEILQYNEPKFRQIRSLKFDNNLFRAFIDQAKKNKDHVKSYLKYSKQLEKLKRPLIFTDQVKELMSNVSRLSTQLHLNAANIAKLLSTLFTTGFFEEASKPNYKNDGQLIRLNSKFARKNIKAQPVESLEIIQTKTLRAPFEYDLTPEELKAGKKQFALTAAKNSMFLNTIEITTNKNLDYFDLIVQSFLDTIIDNNPNIIGIKDVDLANLIQNPLVEKKRIKAKSQFTKDIAESEMTLLQTTQSIDVSRGDKYFYNKKEAFQKFAKENPVISFQLLNGIRVSNFPTSNKKGTLDGLIFDGGEQSRALRKKYAGSLNQIKHLPLGIIKNPFLNASKDTIALYYLIVHKICNMPYSNNSKGRNLIYRRLGILKAAQKNKEILEQEISNLQKSLETTEKTGTIFDSERDRLLKEIKEKQGITVSDLMQQDKDYQTGLLQQQDEKKKNLCISFNEIKKELKITMRNSRLKEYLTTLLDSFKEQLIIKDYQFIYNGKTIQSVAVEIF